MDRASRPGNTVAETASALFLCLFAAQAALLVLSPILPEVAREFEVSVAAVPGTEDPHGR